jgi:hypothetical protein
MAAFFLPRAGDDEQAERLYDALAEFAGCAPAPPGRRVQSIDFTQDGAQWVAAVGEELTGITGAPSEWANPFLAQPDRVTYFDAG